MTFLLVPSQHPFARTFRTFRPRPEGTGRFDPNRSFTPREGFGASGPSAAWVISTRMSAAVITILPKLNSQLAVTLGKLGPNGSKLSRPLNFRSRNLAKVGRSNVRRAARGWLSFLQRFDRRSAAKGLFAVAVPPLFLRTCGGSAELGWLDGHAFLNARTIQIRTQAPTKPAIRYPIHPAKVM